MSQIYVKDRPPPVPLSEYQERRRKRDLQDIVAAGSRLGMSEAAVRANIEQLEKLLPDLVNLDRMKASDWAKVSQDVNGVAAKLILLKTFYPKADVFKVVSRRPRTLLMSTRRITQNAEQVRAMLSRAESIDSIIEAVPELADASTLSQALANIRTWFPNTDPVEFLQKDPEFLLRVGQSDIEDSAEYGELSTKD